MRKKWSNEEIELLKKVYPICMKCKDLEKDFPGRTGTAIGQKATKLGLEYNHEVDLVKKKNRSERQAVINKTILGRDLSPEKIKELAKHYHHRSVFARKDYSAYSTAQKQGILDEVCAHMVKGISFNYPQTLLLEICKELFPNELIRYNDRTAIHPLELDIFIKNKSLAFEYDGVNFHLNNGLDEKKDLICKEAGIDMYRIREVCKKDPYPHIVEQLIRYGFDCSKLDKEIIVNRTIASAISLEEMEEIAKRYTSLTEIWKKEQRVCKMMKACGVFEKFTSHFIPKCKSYTKQEILEFLDTCKSKSDVIKVLRIYSTIRKSNDEDLNKKYHSLPWKNHMKAK